MVTNQIKSLFLSHHHSTSALVSEILESVLQTMQKQFTYRQYIYLQTVQKTMCKKTHTYTQYTQCTIKTYLVTNTHCTHSTLCTHLYIVICEGASDYTLYSIFVQQYRLVVQQIVVQRCKRLYICSVVDVHCMVSSDSRCVVLVQCVRVVQWNCVNVQCMACCVSGSMIYGELVLTVH